MNSEIIDLANYCLNCKNKPCVKACPLGNDIPGFISYIKQNKLEDAAKTLSLTTVLSPLCSIVCPHSKQCMGSCTRGIKGKPVSIDKLENSLGLLPYEYFIPGSKLNRNVAIVGGGPSGITCAAFLKLYGFNVTIFEEKSYLGGLLMHGIPAFRLDKSVVKSAIEKIINLGINVELNMQLGKNISLKNLKEKFDAVYLCFGANVPTLMGIPGENLIGSFGANSLLENNFHPDYCDKTVAIIGGGNVAMDMARTVARKNAKKVYIIYRRSRKEMPAENYEIEDAISDGVEILEQTNIIRIIGNEKVSQIECIKTELIQKNNETRLVPINIENSNFILDIDYVIMATGSKPDKTILENLNLELTEKGYIKIDENYKTSDNQVFAGGDLTGTSATVAWASRTGRDAAKKIYEELK